MQLKKTCCLNQCKGSYLQTVWNQKSPHDDLEKRFIVPTGADFYSDYTVPLGDLFRIFKLMYQFYADDSQLLKVNDPNFMDDNINAVISLQDHVSQALKQ